jgi:hypothetical protein
VTIVRSLGAWDAVHGRAQYYIQTGHPLNLALAKEVPAIGAVAAYELAHDRKASDSLPAYVSMNMESNQAGLVNEGFMSAEFGPMNMRVGTDGPPEMIPRDGVGPTLARRWERLQELDGALRGGAGADRSFAGYHEYYRSAWGIMNDPRISRIFTIPAEDSRALRGQRSRQLARAGAQSVPGRRRHTVRPRQPRRLGSSRRHLQGEDPESPGADPRTRSGARQPDRGSGRHAVHAHAGRTLLDETLVIAMSEFGRVPGPITETRQGREHHIRVHSGIFAGGGMMRNAVVGRTDEAGGDIADAGWSGGRPIYMEDVACTIYSALGIDWTKRIQTTPSGRAFHYVEPASATTFVGFEPVQALFA